LILLLFGERLWGSIVKDIPYNPYVPLTVVTVLAGTSAILPRTIFRVRGEAKKFVTINFFQALSSVTLSVSLVVFFGMGALGPVVGLLVSSAAFFFVYLYYLREYLSPSFSWSIVKKSLAFGLPDSPVRFGNWALKMSNQLVMQYYLPLSAVAIYSVAYSVGTVFFELVVAGINTAVLPFYYQTVIDEGKEKAKEMFSYVAVYNTTLVLFLALFVVLWGKELVLLFASSKYLESVAVVPLIAGSCVFQDLFYIPSRSLYMMKKTIYLLPLLFITVSVNLMLSFLLIPRYGIFGAAIATMMAYLLRIVATLIVSQRVYRIPYDYPRFGKALLAFIVIVAVNHYLAEWNGLMMLATKSVLLGTYPILLYFLGFFEKRELSRLRLGVASMMGNIL